MTFVAKTLVPSGDGRQAIHSAFEDAASCGITVFEDPEGCLPAEHLASALAGRGLQPVWLRLGPEDSDPGTLLLSLVTAARRRHPGIGQDTTRLMQAQPGPVHGWPALWAQLGHELSERLADHGALVLEDPHGTWSRGTVFPLIRAHFLPLLVPVAPCVLVTGRDVPADVVRGCVRRREPELRASDAVTVRVLGECALHLGTRRRDRALAIIGGRQTVLAGIQAACSSAGGDSVADLLRRAGNWERLSARIAGRMLHDAGDEGRMALGLALRTEYAHPAVTGAAARTGFLPAGPWLQFLEEGWTRIRVCWRRPLRAALGRRAAPGRDMLHRVADRLLQDGAGEQAVALYLDLGDYGCAARAIAGMAGELMDLGRWATLDGWLNRLPDQTLSSYPDLMYCQADIASVLGRPALAARRFSNAASWFAKRNDAAGSCRSLLASSAAAADSGDLPTALARANAASSLADTANLAAMRMWAAWQQGRAALLSGDTGTALASFSRAAALTPSGAGAEIQPVREAAQLSMRLEELRKQQATHREAEAALSYTEHQTLNELLASVSTPGWRDSSLAVSGWYKTPAPLKLCSPSPSAAVPPTRPALSWTRLRRMLSAGISPGVNVGHADGNGRPVTVPIPAASPAATPPQQHAVRTEPELAVHLLGPFHVAVNDVPVDNWWSARARSLFGYLVTHRQPWPPREVLMEVFWPGSPPHASRNNLNVALHGLRQILRTATDAPVIAYADGTYRIHPQVRLWLDVDEFDAHVSLGRRAEARGESGRATQEYEFAAELYRGEFLADDPYEEWAALIRERLRLTYLDALGRLSDVCFAAGQYAACVNLCQRILERDSCREDAHRRLMRCYSRQGQSPLALMQYRVCAHALADELGVGPEPATAELYERIRRHEPVLAAGRGPGRRD